MSLANHSSQSGQDIFVETASSTGRPLEVGDWHAYLPWPAEPGGQSNTVVDNDESRGIYPLVDVTDPPTIDQYMIPSGDPVLALNGPEYAAGTTVTRTQTYVSLDADTIRARKDSEGENYAQRVAFSSAQTSGPGSNPNVYYLTREIDLFFYCVVTGFYFDRLKDRSFGENSADGYQPGTDPDPVSWWVRDVPVYLVNASNQNELEIDADEPSWGQVLKGVGQHLLDVRSVLRTYRTDVGAAYDAYVADPSEANRTALISLDPATYAWPPYYDGPTNGTFRVL